MKAKDKIVKLRKGFPLLPSKQIAKQVGVSRQYVHKILLQADLHTAAPSKRKNPTNACLVCGLPTRDYRYRFCSKECRMGYLRVELVCSFCKAAFIITRSQLDQKVRDGYNRPYCSRICFYKGLKDGLVERHSWEKNEN